MIKDITGLKFGKLTAVSLSEYRNPKYRGVYWNCLCDCGNKKVVLGQSLRSGSCTSCGCNHRDTKFKLNISNANRRDGESIALNRVIRQTKQSANKRNLTFELTREEFKRIITQDCSYCGSKPKKIIDVSVMDEERIFTYNGIDRIDSSLGYTKDNSCSCCPTCNYMKLDMGKEDFIEHIYKIHHHMSNRLP